MKKIFVAILMALSFLAQKSQAQCAMYPVSLDDRIDNSEVIIEGQVIQREGFRDPSNGKIYTTNVIEIHKIFKGTITDEELVVISPGGVIEDHAEKVTPSIQLEYGTTALFFLFESDITGDVSYENFKPYSGPQGCIYLKADGSAADVFKSYASIQELYALLENDLGRKQVIKKDEIEKQVQNKSLIDITSVTPDTTIAGIKEEIEIRGSEFGANRGSGQVEFTNASTGLQFVKPTSSDYRFWSDTLIVVRVPSGAGTGPIKVSGAGGIGIQNSPFIKFAQLNYIITTPKQPFHKDDNQSGGFTWRLSTGFDNDNAAKDVFLRAMNNWRDNTCINWDNGSVTSSNQAIDDGINIVRYANSNELPNGVLGVTRSYYRTCGPQTCYVYEIDLSYSPTVNWYKGTGNPSFNQHDMESVIVHELGHAHQLGHVNDEDDFMFATLGQGRKKRDLIDNNIEAGLYVMKNSVITYDCGPDPMVGVQGCSIPVGITSVEKPSLKIYPNPASSHVIFEGMGLESRNVSLIDLEGKVVHEFRIESTSTSYQWQIPSDLNDGIYVLRDQLNGDMLGKISIQR